MIFTREHSYDALASLRPAQVFLDAYHSKRLPEDLEIYFGPPEEFFLAPELQDAYTGGILVPILDDGNFSAVLFLNPTTGQLIQKEIELPEHDVTYESWQQYLARIMTRVRETENNKELLRRISDLIGVKSAADS